MTATAMPGAASGSTDAEPTGPLPEANGSGAATRGIVTFVKGEVTVLRADERSESLGAGATVGPEDVLKTSNGAAVGIDFADHTGLAMGENSILVVEDSARDISTPNPTSLFSIPEGKAVFVGGKTHADAVLIETPAGGLSVGQAGGGVRTLPDGRVELVLFPNGDETIGELIVTNGAGRFVIGTPYVVFTFDYMTPPISNELVPLDEVLGEFSAPLAALAAAIGQPLDQIIGDLVLEDRDGLADDSGLQLAGSDAIVEPDRTLDVTSFRATFREYPQEYPQEYSRSAVQFGSLPGSNRSPQFPFARASFDDEGSNQGPEFPFVRSSSGGDEGTRLLGAASGLPAPASGSDALGDSTPGVTNGSSGDSSGEVTPDAAREASIETVPGVTTSPSGESESFPTPPDQPADGVATENGLIGTPSDDIFSMADHDSFLAIAFIDGREGVDTILGTSGNDVLDFRAPDPVALISIELIDGGRGNDIIITAEGDDVIHGGRGNDVLFGGPDNDRLDGGDDDDILEGDDGDDILDGDDGDDILFGGPGNDILIGNDGEDILQGGSGDDIFIVRGRTDGTDYFDGGPGTDTIQGTDNDDIFHVLDSLANINFIEFIDGRGGFDTILGTNDGDVLDLLASTASVLFSIERIDGGRGNDTIIGTEGNDFIYGSSGQDVLRGGPGNDTLTGGSGNDIFVFHPGDGNTLITDFSSRETVRLEGFGPADVTDAVWDGFNSTIFAGSGSDQISITLEGYSVTDSGLTLVTAFDSSQMTS